MLDYKLDMIDKEKNGWTYIPNILNEYRYCNIILATNLINIKDETEKLSKDPVSFAMMMDCHQLENVIVAFVSVLNKRKRTEVI